MKIDKLIMTRVILAVWIALWLLYLIRPYFKRDLITEYKTLISRPLEGKRSYAAGDKLYGFMIGCRKSIPEKRFTFSVAGLDDYPLCRCRMAYYLYPALLSGDAEYILVFEKPDYGKEGYAIFKRFGGDNYILKKVK